MARVRIPGRVVVRGREIATPDLVRWGLLALSAYMAPATIIQKATDPAGPPDATTAYWTFTPTPGIYNAAPFTVAAHEYPPIFAQVMAPFTSLSWPAFELFWLLLTMTLLLALVGPRWLGAVLLLSPVNIAFGSGGLTFVYALVIVYAARKPWVWAIPILTKITPGVGLLWFVVRREWRNLAIALGITGGLALISFVTVPELWREWFDWARSNAGVAGLPNAMLLPLWLRVSVAAAIVVWGARTNRPWVLFAPLWLAQPTTWMSEVVLVFAGFAPWLRSLAPVMENGRLAFRSVPGRGRESAAAPRAAEAGPRVAEATG